MVFTKLCLFTFLYKTESCCESLNHYSSDGYVIRGSHYSLVLFRMDLSLPAKVLKVNMIDELMIEQYMVS